MADLTITNLTDEKLHIQDIYVTMPPHGQMTVRRPVTELPRMSALQAAIARGDAAVSVALNANEMNSGLTSVSGTVQAIDTAPVFEGSVDASPIVLRKSFSAAEKGTADDVVVFPTNGIPYKIRILDVVALISKGVEGSTIEVRSMPAGDGVLCATLDSGASARVANTAPLSSTVLTPGPNAGLFLRRSNRGVAGEVIITARREN